MIPIFIPTRGRLDKQVTWESIGHEARCNAVLVCPTEECMEHQLRDREVLDRGNIKGINRVRQFILEYAMGEGYDKIIVLDDDLIFGRRISGDAPNLRKTTEDEMPELFNRMSDLLDDYCHVGLSPRQMNDKHFPTTVKYGMRQNAVHGIRPAEIHMMGIRYDTVELMEDYYVTLSLFQQGHGNAVITDWTWDQRGASGAKGGCSTYRDAVMQERASKTLAERFPDHVKVVQKETKTGWDNMKVRWDVRVQWRKAAKDGNCI